MILVCLLALFSILGCIQEEPPSPVEFKGPPDAIDGMPFSDALSIAQGSECTKEGNLTSNYFYNNNSRTWWFDLDVKKQGCAPACVVHENRAAEINWRCTGLVVP